jgi:F0F1-type ATP synthase membrane subunit b/b'
VKKLDSVFDAKINVVKSAVADIKQLIGELSEINEEFGGCSKAVKKERDDAIDEARKNLDKEIVKIEKKCEERLNLIEVRRQPLISTMQKITDVIQDCEDKFSNNTKVKLLVSQRKMLDTLKKVLLDTSMEAYKRQQELITEHLKW